MNCKDTMTKRELIDENSKQTHKKQKIEEGYVYSVCIVYVSDYERTLFHISNVFPTEDAMLKDMKKMYNSKFVTGPLFEDSGYERCKDYKTSLKMLQSVCDGLIEEYGDYVAELKVQRVAFSEEETDYLDGIIEELLQVEDDLKNGTGVDLGDILCDIGNICEQLQDTLGVDCPIKIPGLNTYIVDNGNEDEDEGADEYVDTLSELEDGEEYKMKRQEMTDLVKEVQLWLNNH